MFVKLPLRQRLKAAKIVKLYSALATSISSFNNYEETLWRVKTYVKFGILDKDEYNILVICLETFAKMCAERRDLDPHREFYDVPAMVEKLKAEPKYQEYVRTELNVKTENQ